MNIFISYASEHRSVADSINVKLRGEGHTVFFDKDDLPPNVTALDWIDMIESTCSSKTAWICG